MKAETLEKYTTVYIFMQTIPANRKEPNFISVGYRTAAARHVNRQPCRGIRPVNSYGQLPDEVRRVSVSE